MLGKPLIKYPYISSSREKLSKKGLLIDAKNIMQMISAETDDKLNIVGQSTRKHFSCQSEFVLFPYHDLLGQSNFERNNNLPSNYTQMQFM